jgi:hypothetical protein
LTPDLRPARAVGQDLLFSGWPPNGRGVVR